MFGHVLKRQIAAALERVCFDGAQSVSWSRWTDPVRVEDAVLKPDVLSKIFQLPLEISGGYIGSLLVDVADGGGGISVVLDRLLLVVVARPPVPADPARSLLKAVNKILKKIFRVARVRVANFHLRLEDPERHAVLGLTCRSFEYTEISGNFRSLGIYSQVDQAELISTTELSSRTARFRRLMNSRTRTPNYLVHPFSGNFSLIGNFSLEISDLINVSLPRLDVLKVLLGMLPRGTSAKSEVAPDFLVGRVRVLVTSANGTERLLTIAGVAGRGGRMEMTEVEISDHSGTLKMSGVNVDLGEHVLEIAKVEIDRKNAEASDESRKGDEAFSPRSLGGYDSDWASVTGSVFFEARSPRASPKAAPIRLPRTDWRLIVEEVSVIGMGEVRGVKMSSDTVEIEEIKWKEGEVKTVGVKIDMQRNCMHVANFPDFSVHATEISASTSSLGFSLFVRLSDELGLELQDVTINQDNISIMRGEMKILSDVSVLLSSCIFDIHTRTCEQASLTLLESNNIPLMRLSLSEISVLNNHLHIRQINLRNLFAAWRSDPSYVALKDVSASPTGAVTVEAVMAHIGTDTPALVRKISGLFVPPSTERYAVENGLWTAVQLVALTSAEEKFIACIPPHTTNVLDFPRKFRLVIVKDFAGRLIGTLSRGKRDFAAFYFCRPVLGRLSPGAISLRVEFQEQPIPGTNFLRNAENSSMNFRLDVATVRLVLAPSDQISVHAEIDGLTVAKAQTLRESSATKISLETFVLIDRSNPADPLLDLGHSEVWKEADRMFFSVPQVKVHADLEVAEHLNTIKSVFQSSFLMLRAFSKPAIPALVVVNAFELELYAKRLFKVLALDKAPLQLRQCVLREPDRLGELADWYIDEISGQWLQLALHIDVYGQPMAVLRNFTGRVKALFRSVLSTVTLGHV